MGWASTPTQITGTQVASSASANKSFPATVTNNNMIVVNVVTFHASSHVTHAITDDKGNTYTQVGSYGQYAASGDQSIWICQDVQNAPKTITVTPSSSAFITFEIAEWALASGGHTSGTLTDGNNFGSATSTSLDSGAITVSQAGDLLIGNFTTNGSGTTVFTPNGTIGYSPGAGGAAGDQSFAGNYQIVSANSDVTATIGASILWGAYGVSIKAPGSVPGNLFQPVHLQYVDSETGDILAA